MAAHTPGPWRLWLDKDDRGAFTLNGDSPEPHGAGMLIVQRNIGTPNGDEGVANARLIAAAPELLDALKAAVALADSNVRNFNGRSAECQASYDRCVAAIAKAEGREAHAIE